MKIFEVFVGKKITEFEDETTGDSRNFDGNKLRQFEKICSLPYSEKPEALQNHKSGIGSFMEDTNCQGGPYCLIKNSDHNYKYFVRWEMRVKVGAF